MSNQIIGRLGVVRRLTAGAVLTSILSGCLTTTSVGVRETPGTPVQRVRLVRADALPIAGTFQQEGHAVVGQLTLPAACNADTVQRVKREEVTDTHTVRGVAIAYVVTGVALGVVAAGAFAASGDADKRVTCGQGRDGDTCRSKSSSLQEVGLSTLLLGLTTGVVGGIFLAKKPQVESKEMPARELSRVTSEGIACAPAAKLAGVVVGLELPGNGTWSGITAMDGSVRIEVQPTIRLPVGTKVPIVVQSVPATFAATVPVGSQLGEISFEKPQAPPVPTQSGKSAKR